jgi:hypothetical protein
MTGWIFEDPNRYGLLGLPGLPGLPGLHAADSLTHTPEYLLDDSGQLSAVSQAHGGSGGLLGGGGGGTGSGSPASTLVGSSNGLEINLIWDSSVRSAANWSAIEQAVVTAAKIYTADFATRAILNIQVGLGEVNGTALGGNALGESETYGYGVSYATLTKALATADAGLVSSHSMAAGAVTAVSALAGDTFFVASAEMKALGLLFPLSSGVDGYIGLASGGALAFAGTPGSTQYDAVGVAAHELSEVMGRLGMVGTGSGGYYTPLDLFRYTGLSQPATTPGLNAYFSLDLGKTQLNNFNDPALANAGDLADWATTSAPTDAYNAFGTPGNTLQVTHNDLLAVAALGYHPSNTLPTVMA